MNVLRINTSSLEGGAAQSALNINQTVLSKGINSVMLSARDKSDNGNNIISLNESILRRYINILAYRIMGKEGYLNDNLWKKILDNLDHYDVIHLHNVHGYYLPTRVLKKLLEKPCVWTLHDYWLATGGPGSPVKRNNKFVEKLFFFSSLSYPKEIIDRSEVRRKNLKLLLDKYHPNLVAITNNMAGRLKSMGLTDNELTVIHHGLFKRDSLPPTHEEKREVKRKLGWSTKVNNFIFVSAQVDNKIKGFDVLLKSLQKLDCQNWHLYVIGDKYQKSQDKSKQIANHVTFLGKVPGDKMNQYYLAADTYISCSFSETYGRTVVESLAQCTNVICSDLEVLREVTMGHGKIFETGNHVDLSKKIEETLTKPDAYSDKIHIAKKIRDKFSKESMAEKYITLYESLYKSV